MSKNPLRLALGLTNHVYIGRLTKDGMCFRDGKQDVTTDFYKAVVDRFCDGEEEHTIRCSDGREWLIKVQPREPEGKAQRE